MSARLTHPEQGKLILNAFEHFKARPGSVIRPQQLNSYMTGHQLHATDLHAGVAYCLTHKWVEAQPNATYKLTPVGYSKISSGA
jgi:hypothetical protein